MTEQCEKEDCSRPCATMTIRGYECELIYCQPCAQASTEPINDLIADANMDEPTPAQRTQETLLEPPQVVPTDPSCVRVTQAFQFILTHAQEHKECPEVWQVFQTIIENAPKEATQ